jgi:hypothetical protein
MNPVLTESEAVVGGEDHVGVVELAGGAKRGNHLGDPLVDVKQRRQAAAVLPGHAGDPGAADVQPGDRPAVAGDRYLLAVFDPFDEAID